MLGLCVCVRALVSWFLRPWARSLNPGAHFLSTLSPRKDELMLRVHVWSTCIIASQDEYSVCTYCQLVVYCAALHRRTGTCITGRYPLGDFVAVPITYHNKCDRMGRKKAALLSRPGRANPSKACIRSKRCVVAHLCVVFYQDCDLATCSDMYQ